MTLLSTSKRNHTECNTDVTTHTDHMTIATHVQVGAYQYITTLYHLFNPANTTPSLTAHLRPSTLRRLRQSWQIHNSLLLPHHVRRHRFETWAATIAAILFTAARLKTACRTAAATIHTNNRLLPRARATHTNVVTLYNNYQAATDAHLAAQSKSHLHWLQTVTKGILQSVHTTIATILAPCWLTHPQQHPITPLRPVYEPPRDSSVRRWADLSDTNDDAPTVPQTPDTSPLRPLNLANRLNTTPTIQRNSPPRQTATTHHTPTHRQATVTFPDGTFTQITIPLNSHGVPYVTAQLLPTPIPPSLITHTQVLDHTLAPIPPNMTYHCCNNNTPLDAEHNTPRYTVSSIEPSQHATVARNNYHPYTIRTQPPST
jgi:hypothetical protein